AFYLCRQFLPTFLANRFGRFILISSLGATGVSGQANYCASKAGLLGLSATLAKEYGKRGLTSNVVSPGLFATDMTRAGVPASNRLAPIPAVWCCRCARYARRAVTISRRFAMS